MLAEGGKHLFDGWLVACAFGDVITGTSRSDKSVEKASETQWEREREEQQQQQSSATPFQSHFLSPARSKLAFPHDSASPTTIQCRTPTFSSTLSSGTRVSWRPLHFSPLRSRPSLIDVVLLPRERRERLGARGPRVLITSSWQLPLFSSFVLLAFLECPCCSEVLRPPRDFSIQVLAVDFSCYISQMYIASWPIFCLREMDASFYVVR